MEMKEKGEGGEDEGRKVTRSEKEREREREREGWGKMEKRMRGVGDAADPSV